MDGGIHPTTTTHFTIGCEVEGNVTGKDMCPLDLREHFKEGPLFQIDHARLELDAGRDQIELITNPSQEVQEHVAELMCLQSHVATLEEDVEFYFTPQREVGTPTNVDDFFKPRLKALLAALQDPSEGGADGLRVIESGNINALHFHFDVSEFCHDEQVQIMNLLNWAAPAMLRWFYQRFGLKRTERNAVWTDFARPARLPAPRWFKDYASYQAWYEQIPRLIMCVGDSADKNSDHWEVDLETSQSLSDLASESTMWPAVRLRRKYNTVELRAFPTIGDWDAVAETMVIVDEWLTQAVDRLLTKQFRSIDEVAATGIVTDFMGVGLPSTQLDWQLRWKMY